ncbi:SGNH/GDSL hydrolase family protein [Mucilaginibacter lacusdianchii]|uniref:SGNH/GDSL hydrolase family protein n=1 Tax=Mucilaginibacter lacusdianchii TaxID=2684211 RepID=UPI00131B20EF|nr:SGNH/GDSL hydrolase family protein [Mucilaginibacter sp. JXJ CY 39]
MKHINCAYYAIVAFILIFLSPACRSTKGDPAPWSRKIVVLGSSTAAGFGLTNPDSSWVNRLDKKLAAENKDIRILNLAVPGFSTYEVKPNYSEVPTNRPHWNKNHNISKALSYNTVKVIISLPNNDIANNYTDDEIIANYKTLTALLDEKQIPYVITSTQPRNFTTQSQQIRIKELNDKLLAIYKNNYCDYLNKLCTSDYRILNTYSLGDGVHLNSKGHDVIYKSLLMSNLFK